MFHADEFPFLYFLPLPFCALLAALLFPALALGGSHSLSTGVLVAGDARPEDKAGEEEEEIAVVVAPGLRSISSIATRPFRLT